MITKYLFDTLYIQIAPQTVSAKSLNQGVVQEERPEVAIDERGEVLAVGKDAARFSVRGSQGGVRIYNPFSHQRAVVSDRHAAEHLFVHLVRLTYGRENLLPELKIILHLDSQSGEITNLEAEALTQAALNAGAKKVYIYVGGKLSDAELSAITYPGEGVLFYAKK